MYTPRFRLWRDFFIRERIRRSSWSRSRYRRSSWSRSRYRPSAPFSFMLRRLPTSTELSRLDDLRDRRERFLLLVFFLSGEVTASSKPKLPLNVIWKPRPRRTTCGASFRSRARPAARGAGDADADRDERVDFERFFAFDRFDLARRGLPEGEAEREREGEIDFDSVSSLEWSFLGACAPGTTIDSASDSRSAM